MHSLKRRKTEQYNLRKQKIKCKLNSKLEEGRKYYIQSGDKLNIKRITIEKINNQKFFIKINKIDKLLTRLTKSKRRLKLLNCEIKKGTLLILQE